MRYYKRLKKYKASNVEFDCKTETAYSYGWWQFVKRIKGKLIFNNFRYSPSTCRHQLKISRLLGELGLKIDYVIGAPAGLQNLVQAIRHHQILITNLLAQIDKKGTHRAKNIERQTRIEQHSQTIELIQSLI